MSASKSRSPNYPAMDLGESIEAIRGVYAKEKRAKFPRQSLATHLGYSSLNGRALAKIGALRAYGLIEGREDALQVSNTAIALLEAPKDSEDYIEAIHEAFNSPPLFVRILSEHGDEVPSDHTLRWWLAKQGYVGEAADRALKVYLASVSLVNSVPEPYKGPVAVEPPAKEATKFGSMDDLMNSVFPPPKGQARKAEAPQESLAMGVHERVLQSGMLSKTASYRLIVSGHVGETEIDRLLKKLEMDKEILADPDPEPKGQELAPDDTFLG